MEAASLGDEKHADARASCYQDKAADAAGGRRALECAQGVNTCRPGLGESAGGVTWAGAWMGAGWGRGPLSRMIDGGLKGLVGKGEGSLRPAARLPVGPPLDEPNKETGQPWGWRLADRRLT